MRRNALLTLALVLWWSAVAAIYAAMLSPMARLARPDLNGTQVLLVSWLGWLLWVPLCLVIIAAVARNPIAGGRLLPALTTAAACMALAITAKAVFVYFVNDMVSVWYPTPPLFRDVMLDSASSNFILAGLVIGTAHALHYARAEAASRLRIVALEGSLSRARLDMLSAQLNPHFLFNALNAIAETVHDDPDAADAMIVSLSLLLRQSLDRTGDHLITLAEEVTLLDHYLSLQRLRLGDRLAIGISIADDCQTALVPRLLLQPLAENAIVHGIGRRRAGGRLQLDVEAAAGVLCLRLTSDGALTTRAGTVPGIGLANVRQRLETLFGAEAKLTIGTVAGERTQVVVTQPLLAATA
jgi:two-component system, LytTR family, sensor kinase